MINLTVRNITPARKCVWDHVLLAWHVTRSEPILQSFFPELKKSLVGIILEDGGSEDGHKGLVVNSKEEVREARDKVVSLVKAKH